VGVRLSKVLVALHLVVCQQPPSSASQALLGLRRVSGSLLPPALPHRTVNGVHQARQHRRSPHRRHKHWTMHRPPAPLSDGSAVLGRFRASPVDSTCDAVTQVATRPMRRQSPQLALCHSIHLGHQGSPVRLQRQHLPRYRHVRCALAATDQHCRSRWPTPNEMGLHH
jgi:hypothetical protein